MLFDEFAEERDAANRVKREEQVIVVLGNPPYSAFAGTSPEQEEGLVDPYKVGLSTTWGVKKYNLDDLFVRFFRLAERSIAERGGRGVVSFISNSAWTSGASFVVMRQRLLESFDAIWVDNMNGDSRETGKLTPDGKPDPSVFSTERNREGIQVGTAVALLVRRPEHGDSAEVKYRDFWGATKRADLLASIDDPAAAPGYEIVEPVAEAKLSLKPRKVSASYLEWPRLTDLPAIPPTNGLMEKRGGALIDIDSEPLEARMRAYFDPDVEWTTLAAFDSGLTRDAAGYDARSARAKVTSVEPYQHERLIRYAVRPFEDRFAYYTAVPPLWNRARPSLFAQVAPDNAFVLSRVGASARDEGVPFYFTAALSDDHLLSPDASCFSLLLPQPTGGLLGSQVTEASRGYLAAVGVPAGDERELAGLVWYHALAVGYSPQYLSENADGVKTDWPRIPYPTDPTVLAVSASLGATVAEILDPSAAKFGTPFPVVRPDSLGALDTRASSFDPDTDLGVTARWAIAGAGGRVMPSTGKLDPPRDYSAEELAAIEAAALSMELTLDDALGLLGKDCLDVYLNESVFWRGIPTGVWEFTVGGYQVIKKWLSYREKSLLGRNLTPDEARYVTEVVGRISALMLLQPRLDEVYEQSKRASWRWPT
jgi:hypothetical protein